MPLRVEYTPNPERAGDDVRDLTEWNDELLKAMAYDSMGFSCCMLDRDMKLYAPNPRLSRMIRDDEPLGLEIWDYSFISWSDRLKRQAKQWRFDATHGESADRIVQLLMPSGDLEWTHIFITHLNIPEGKNIINFHAYRITSNKDLSQPTSTKISALASVAWGGWTTFASYGIFESQPQIFKHLSFYGSSRGLGGTPLALGLIVAALSLATYLSTRHSTNRRIDAMMSFMASHHRPIYTLKIVTLGMLSAFWSSVAIGLAQWQWFATSTPSYSIFGALCVISLVQEKQAKL